MTAQSYHGTISAAGTIAFGTMAANFTLTDVVVAMPHGLAGVYPTGLVTVGGTAVLGLPCAYDKDLQGGILLPVSFAPTAGVFIASGAVVAFASTGVRSGTVTLVGFIP